MLLENLSLDSIKETDLQTLVDDKVQESRRIEYKAGRPATNDDEKKKFLVQVSSFANASGGFLLYGVDAPHGVPVGLPGFDADDPDAEKQRLANVIRDGTDPRIWGVNIGMTRLATGKWIVIVHVPQSFNPPHMVTLGGDDRFYSRGPAGKYRLDVAELRTIFGLAETAARRIRAFRAERLTLIQNGETPVPLLKGTKLVLHMVPFDSFTPGRTYDLSPFAKDPAALPNISWRVHDGRYNFDGFVSCASSLRSDNPRRAYSYTQCFRNGIIETLHMAYDPREEDSVKKTLSLGYEDMLVRSVRGFLTIQDRMGVAFPVFTLISFLDTKGVSITSKGEFADTLYGSTALARDDLILPEVVMEDSQCDAGTRMRPVFDIVLNTIGLEPKRSN
jgi:hypothetical protein